MEKPTPEQLDHRYGWRPPQGTQGDHYVRIRKAVREFANVLLTCTPACREQERALDALDDLLAHCNAAIMRHG